MMAASSLGMGVGRTASPFSKGGSRGIWRPSRKQPLQKSPLAPLCKEGNSHTVTPPNNQSAQMQ